MGIYRTLLEEEVPHLDDNNNPDDQIKELQDVIEDQDANQAEQDAAQDAAYGPDCGVDDIMDESAMAIYEFEAGHAQIMQAIGMHELSEAAMGRDFIFEAADIKGFFKSVKDKIVAFFKKVWSVLQRWAGNLGAMFTSNKKFVDKYSAAMKDGYAICTGGKYDGKKLKGYEFTGIEKSIAIAKANKDSSWISDNANEFLEAIRKAAEAKSDISSEAKTTAEEIEQMSNAIRGGFCGKESVSTSDFSSSLKEFLYGAKEPKEMWMKVEEVTTILNDKKNNKKAVTDFTSAAKKQMKTALDKVSQAEKAASKMDNSTNRNSLMAECARMSNYIRSALATTQTWRSATLSAINAQGRQARKYGMAYVMAANKSKHKGFQKESAEYGFLGNLGLV